MGVTHKLKAEVVEFIVQTKTNSPKMGVRKLADLTGEKFGMTISKSSVSNVLKEAELSSPVGRRRAEGEKFFKSKQFEIPSDTKKAIRESVEKLGQLTPKADFPSEGTADLLNSPVSGKDDALTEKVIEEEIKKDDSSSEDAFGISGNLISETEENLPTDMPEQEGAPADSEDGAALAREEDGPVEEKMHLRPDPVEEDELKGEDETPTVGEWVGKNADEAYQDFALGHAIQIRAQRQYIISSPLKGFGTIFLHAASRDISTKPFMGDFLKTALVSDEILYIDKLCEHEVYQQLWSKFTRIPSDAITDYGYWEFLGFRHPPDTSKFQQLICSGKPQNRVVMEYFTQKEQTAVKVGSIRLQLRDSSRLIIDSSMVSLWSRPGESARVTLNSAARLLSQRIISNVDPIILGMVPDDQALLKSFMLMCENETNKQVLSAALISEKGEDIASFSIIPKHRRKMIAGVYPQQKVFGAYSALINEREDCRVCYEELSDQLVYYRYCLKEVELEGGAGKVLCKVIGVYDDEHKPLKCIILSNMTGKTEQEIIQLYLKKWPCYNAGIINCSIIEQRAVQPVGQKEKAFVNIDKLDSYEKIILDYGEHLHQFVWKNYFYGRIENDVNIFFRNIYSLFGAVEMTKNNLLVYLMPPKEPRLEGEVLKAAGIVNERQILDDHGRVIYISVVK